MRRKVGVVSRQGAPVVGRREVTETGERGNGGSGDEPSPR